jgi:hypothetical protein
MYLYGDWGLFNAAMTGWYESGYYNNYLAATFKIYLKFVNYGRVYYNYNVYLLRPL